MSDKRVPKYYHVFLKGQLNRRISKKLRDAFNACGLISKHQSDRIIRFMKKDPNREFSYPSYLSNMEQVQNLNKQLNGWNSYPIEVNVYGLFLVDISTGNIHNENHPNQDQTEIRKKAVVHCPFCERDFKETLVINGNEIRHDPAAVE
jgi:hypothetical protein